MIKKHLYFSTCDMRLRLVVKTYEKVCTMHALSNGVMQSHTRSPWMTAPTVHGNLQALSTVHCY